jgi:hypothetical protein
MAVAIGNYLPGSKDFFSQGSTLAGGLANGNGINVGVSLDVGQKLLQMIADVKK